MFLLNLHIQLFHVKHFYLFFVFGNRLYFHIVDIDAVGIFEPFSDDLGDYFAVGVHSIYGDSTFYYGLKEIERDDVLISGFVDEFDFRGF